MPLYAGNIQNSDSHREYGQGTSIYFRNFIKTFLIDYADYADYADDADYAGDSHREYGQGTSIYFRNFIKTFFDRLCRLC